MNVAENNRSKRTWRLPAAWTALIVFDLCLVALAYAQDAPTKIEQPEVVDSVVVQIEGPNDVALDDERFEAIDWIKFLAIVAVIMTHSVLAPSWGRFSEWDELLASYREHWEMCA